MNKNNESLTGTTALFNNSHDVRIITAKFVKQATPLLIKGGCFLFSLSCLSACFRIMPGFVGVTESGVDRKAVTLVRNQ